MLAGDLRGVGGSGGGTARLLDRLRDEPGGGADGKPEEGDGLALILGEGSALRDTVTPLRIMGGMFQVFLSIFAQNTTKQNVGDHYSLSIPSAKL